jgi:hypothetical protein
MNDNLKNSLTSLHASLAATEKVDPEMIALLQVLDSDIHLLLGKTAHDSSQASDLAGRTQEYAAQFAAQHPQIEAILRELASTLGKMGI